MNYSNKLQVRFFIPIAEWLLSMGCDEAITEDCHNKQKLYESRYNINADNQETSKKALDSFNIPDDCKTIINLENLVKENIFSINSKAFKGFVFYEGNPEADLMIIADTPDTLDINNIKSFQKENGILLLAMLKAINFNEKNTFFTSLSFCSSINGLKPSNKDMLNNIDIVKKQIDIVSPKAVIMFGSNATQCLTGSKEGIFSTRGKKYKIEVFDSKKSFPAISTYNPEYLIARPEKKRDAWLDLCEVKKIVETSS